MDPTRRRRLLPWLAVWVVYALVRWRFLDVPLDRDEGVFGWIGQSILRGDVPYVDVFDHKPPGVFYVYALALTVVPATAAGVHLFLALWNAATLAVLASTARAMAGREAALWTAWLFVFASAAAPVQGFATTTEMLLLLPLAGSLRLVFAARAAGASRRREIALLLAAGACAAAACWIKQSAGIALFALPLLLLSGRRFSAAARDAGALLAGGVLLSVVVMAPFAAIGGFEEFWYWSFTHSVIYGAWSWEQVTTEEWRADVVRNAGALLPVVAIPLIAAGTGLVRACRRSRHAWLAVFVVTSVLSTLHSAFLYTHYFAQLVPAVCLAGGLGLAAVQGRIVRDAATPARRIGVALALAGAVAGLPVLADRGYWLTDPPDALIVAHAGPQGFEAAPLVAGHLAARSNPDAWIYVHGSEPQLAFLADRRLANPYGMAYPLTGPYPRAREFQERVWATIERTEPRFIVTTRNDVSLMTRPETDTFLAQRFAALIDRAYEIDAQLVEGRGTWTLVRDRPAAELHGLRRQAFLSIWRRR